MYLIFRTTLLNGFQRTTFLQRSSNFVVQKYSSSLTSYNHSKMEKFKLASRYEVGAYNVW